jgi:hypothetical protein
VKVKSHGRIERHFIEGEREREKENYLVRRFPGFACSF